MSFSAMRAHLFQILCCMALAGCGAYNPEMRYQEDIQRDFANYTACVNRAAANPSYAELSVHTSLILPGSITEAQQNDTSFADPKVRVEIISWLGQVRPCDEAIENAAALDYSFLLDPVKKRHQSNSGIYTQVADGKLDWKDANAQILAVSAIYMADTKKALDDQDAQVRQKIHEEFQEVDSHSHFSTRSDTSSCHRYDHHLVC